MLRSTLEGDMDKKQCPECNIILQKLWDYVNGNIRYFCNTCEKVMIYHKATGKMETLTNCDIQDNR